MGSRVVDGRGLAAELKGRLEVGVADFMEAGVVPGLIKKEHVREGVIAIDVGISFRRDPRTGKEGFVGDLDFAGVAAVAEALSPVPGGGRPDHRGLAPQEHRRRCPGLHPRRRNTALAGAGGRGEERGSRSRYNVC